MNSRKHMPNLHRGDVEMHVAQQTEYKQAMNDSGQHTPVGEGGGTCELYTHQSFLLQLTICGHKKVCTYVKPQIAKQKYKVVQI